MVCDRLRLGLAYILKTWKLSLSFDLYLRALCLLGPAIWRPPFLKMILRISEGHGPYRPEISHHVIGWASHMMTFILIIIVSKGRDTLRLEIPWSHLNSELFGTISWERACSELFSQKAMVPLDLRFVTLEPWCTRWASILVRLHNIGILRRSL